MQGKRIDRISHLIHMELGNLILSKVKDPRLGFVTVTHVNVTPDLKQAFVYYSVLGDAKAKETTRKVLIKSAGFLQKEIGANLKLRFTPKLEFRLDESIDKGLEIDQLLAKLHKDKPPAPEEETS